MARSVYDGLVARDPVQRAAAVARAKLAARAVGRMALEFGQEWLAAEREHVQAQRAALDEYTRATALPPGTQRFVVHPPPPEPQQVHVEVRPAAAGAVVDVEGVLE